MSETFEQQERRLRRIVEWDAPHGIDNADIAAIKALLARYEATQVPCRCDPPGSGEEFCNGACERRQLRTELENLRAERNRQGVELRRAVSDERRRCAALVRTQAQELETSAAFQERMNCPKAARMRRDAAQALREMAEVLEAREVPGE